MTTSTVDYAAIQVAKDWLDRCEAIERAESAWLNSDSSDTDADAGRRHLQACEALTAARADYSRATNNGEFTL